jgi:hypothetical protein
MALTTYAGIINANEFAYGTALGQAGALQVLQGSTSTGAYTILCAPASLTTSSGLKISITVNTPITIGSDSGIETVTPTAVSTNNLNQLLITATFTYAHGTGAQVRSGSYGLQEAAEYAKAKGGGLIALNWAWFQANGLTTNAGLTTLLGTYNSLSANTTVLNYGGIAGALSYAAAAASAYASTAHVLY